MCKGGYFAGREMISFCSGVLEMKKSTFWKEVEEKKNLGEGEMGKVEGGVGKKMP